MYYVQAQLVVDWLEKSASEVMQAEKQDRGSDSHVAWENTLRIVKVGYAIVVAVVLSRKLVHLTCIHMVFLYCCHFILFVTIVSVSSCVDLHFVKLCFHLIEIP